MLEHCSDFCVELPTAIKDHLPGAVLKATGADQWPHRPLSSFIRTLAVDQSRHLVDEHSRLFIIEQQVVLPAAGCPGTVPQPAKGHRRPNLMKIGGPENPIVAVVMETASADSDKRLGLAVRQAVKSRSEVAAEP
jgi:hypothetical protein